MCVCFYRGYYLESVIVTIVSLFMCSCLSSQDECSFKAGIISIGDNTFRHKNLSISDMDYNIEIIPLETTDSCLLNGNAHIIYASNTDVLISDGRKIFRFDENGNFKNSIGTVGDGPMEHLAVFKASFDAMNNQLYIYDGHKKIITWNLDGIPVSETFIDTDGYIPLAIKMGNGYFAEERVWGKDNKMRIFNIHLNKEGVKDEILQILNLSGVEEINYFPSSIVSENSNIYYYYNPYGTELYEITDKSITTKYKFDLGDFAPNIKLLGNMTYREKNRGEFIELLDIVLSGDMMFLLYHIGNNIFGYLLNTESGKVLLHSDIGNPMKGGGLKLNDNSEICVWPHYSRDKDLYSLCNLYEYDSFAGLGNMNKSLYEMGENSNPCLIIMKKKYEHL